ALVVEVVKQRGQTPGFFVGAVLTGVGADAGFDRQHVFAQAFGLRVFAEELPGIVSGWHRRKFTVGISRKNREELTLRAQKLGERGPAKREKKTPESQAEQEDREKPVPWDRRKHGGNRAKRG